MLSLEDCIGFSGLTPDQLDAVAHRRHMPAVIAAEWAEMVLEGPDGVHTIEAVLVEELGFARRHHDGRDARRCQKALAEFRRRHC
ncbi:MAG: hypothetical protein HQL39_00240 [Alphaproteobacteria bacterium]|nr:hypothetical protein [Alphaproteobacteria bacterium]